jgi:hypothetical protein
MSQVWLAEVSGLVNRVERDDYDNVRMNVYCQPSYYSKKNDTWKKQGDPFYLTVTIRDKHDAYIEIKRLLEQGVFDQEGKPKSRLQVTLGGDPGDGTTGVSLTFTKKEAENGKTYVNHYVNLAPWGKLVFGPSLNDGAAKPKAERAKAEDSPFG